MDDRMGSSMQLNKQEFEYVVEFRNEVRGDMKGLIDFRSEMRGAMNVLKLIGTFFGFFGALLTAGVIWCAVQLNGVAGKEDKAEFEKFEYRTSVALDLIPGLVKSSADNSAKLADLDRSLINIQQTQNRQERFQTQLDAHQSELDSLKVKDTIVSDPNLKKK